MPQTRRSFIKSLVTAAAAAWAAPAVTMATQPTGDTVFFVYHNDQFAYMVNMLCDNPRRLGVVTSIE